MAVEGRRLSPLRVAAERARPCRSSPGREDWVPRFGRGLTSRGWLRRSVASWRRRHTRAKLFGLSSHGWSVAGPRVAGGSGAGWVTPGARLGGDDLRRGVLEDTVDDAGPVEAGHHRHPTRDLGRLEPRAKCIQRTYRSRCGGSAASGSSCRSAHRSRHARRSGVHVQQRVGIVPARCAATQSQRIEDSAPTDRDEWAAAQGRSS